MISAVAGTFDVIHAGHKALLDRAFAIGDAAYIGITSDRMAKEGRSDFVPLAVRLPALERILASYGKPYRVFEIDDIYGPSDIMDRVDTLVVSQETATNGASLNEDRIRRGVGPLEIQIVPLVMAADGEKISARRILEGQYGREGSCDVPDIIVGSANHVKIEAVRSVFEKLLGEVRVTGIDVPSGVPEQPFEEQTRTGAENRARAALGDHDISIGIEAGVYELPDGLYDIQQCCVIDRHGRITRGQGSGFRYPDEVASLVRGGMTVGDAFHELFGDSEIGKHGGAIGMLSRGALDRKTLTEQSIMAAMIPRIWRN